MGRRRRMETTLFKKNNSIQDSVGNEENGYPVPEPKKATIDVTRSPVIPTKNLQRGNLGRNL
jgi:hypothetical protein